MRAITTYIIAPKCNGKKYDSEYTDIAMELIYNLVDKNDEIILKVQKLGERSRFDVVTDNGFYCFRIASMNLRGICCNELYIIGEIDEELKYYLVSRVMPIDLDYRDWDWEEHIHFIDIERWNNGER